MFAIKFSFKQSTLNHVPISLDYLDYITGFSVTVNKACNIQWSTVMFEGLKTVNIFLCVFPLHTNIHFNISHTI